MVVIMVWNVCGIIFFIFCLLFFFDKENCDIVKFIEYKFKSEIKMYCDFIYSDFYSFVKIDYSDLF